MAYIEVLNARVAEPVVPFFEILKQVEQGRDWSEFTFRRVEVVGEYDFAHEMSLRNRRFEETPGVLILTPLLPSQDSKKSLLVSRGFIPLQRAAKIERARFQHSKEARFIGLIKEGSERRFLAPSDPPTGSGLPWVDGWLRVDLAGMSKQLPYELLPIYVELMDINVGQNLESDVVKSASGRSDVLSLVKSGAVVSSGDLDVPDSALPIAAYDTVVPPGRHLGYVYEWAFLAALTLLIGLILQLRRGPQSS